MENLNACEKFLFELLSDHPIVEISYIREKAKEQKFKRADLKAAKKILKVKTYHQFDEGKETGNWFWYLPENFTP